MENSSALCPGSATLDRFWMEHHRIGVFLSLEDNILPFEFEFEKDSYRNSPLLEYSASFFWIPF
jgi:hypothetical protein